MSTFKKLLALTLALAMVLSVSAFAGYSADTYADADKIDPDCEDAVELLYALDIMKGDGKNFNPEASVTRAEMAKMIYVVLNYGKDDKAVTYTGAKLFSDVVAGAWYEGYVNYCGVTKLVQGRPDGTFGPMDPVTCAEAAKMLLTAIGYTAEDRGYVGADWAKNVLSDAALVGLLDNYGYNTNTFAPRQWVAVMMENALWADTYKTVRPVTFNGLLTSSAKLDDDVITMGKKYYKLASFEGVAIATTSATLVNDAAEDYVLFDDGEDEVEVANTGLGSLDLGQTYKVIFKLGSDKDNDAYIGSAYSVRSLSDVAESHVHDMEVEVKYGISSNKAANKFEFTIGDMVAKFNAKEIPVLYTGTEYTEKAVKATKLGVQDMYDAVEDGEGAEPTNDVYKMIDTDANGTIDYVIVVEYDYAQVSKVGSHNKYGEYVQLNGAVVDAVEFDGDSKLYLEDTIICDEDLEKTDFVKYTWDLDEGKYALEVLTPVEGATYEARDNKKAIYTIDGDDYMLADNAFNQAVFEEYLQTKKLGKSINFVADGDMLVARWDDDDTYITELAAVNEMLALVIDVDATFSTGTLHEKPYIEYMTIDGETQIAEYKNKTGYVQFSELEELSMDEYEGEEDLADRLFVYELDKNGKISLAEISFDAKDKEITLIESVVDDALLNLYEVKGDFETGVELDATESSVKFDGDKMAADNSFFYAYDDDGEAVFGVITPAELGDGEDDTAYGQVMSYEKSTNGRTTVLAGYIVFDLTSDENDDYLVITEIGKETADGLQLTVQFVGGDEETIYVSNDQTYYTDLLYSYNYKTMDDEYTLTLVEDVDGSVKWLDEEDAEICLAKDGEDDITLDISDDDEVAHIVVVTIEYLRDETQTPETEADDSQYVNEDLYEEYDRTLEIVAYEDLAAADIEADTTDSYEQTSYWYYENELLYIVVLHDMTQAQ